MSVAQQLLRASFEDVEIDYESLREWRTKTPLSNIGNLVVDWFTLEERLNTRMKSNTSFYEFLENFESRWYIKPGVARLYNLRTKSPHICRVKSAYNFYIGNPTIFKPLATLSFLDILPCKVGMMDPTAGWGGRAVGAAVFGVPHYIGIDSNTNLREPYSRLCNFLESRSKTNITMIFDDALNIDYGQFRYDLVMTSYPYYNIERYSNYKQYKTKREMNETFYKPLTLELFKNLLPEGHLALNVSPEIYEYISSFMGESFMKIPFISRNRNSEYREYLYVWYKDGPGEYLETSANVI